MVFRLNVKVWKCLSFKYCLLKIQADFVFSAIVVGTNENDMPHSVLIFLAKDCWLKKMYVMYITFAMENALDSFFKIIATSDRNCFLPTDRYGGKSH
jgi:hypothetical protein